MSTFDELRNQLRQTKTQATKTSVANKLSFDEARNIIHNETIKSNTQKSKEVKEQTKPKETAKPINPFPHRSDLKSNVATKQPVDNGSIMSQETFFKNLSPEAKLSYTKNKIIGNLKNTALNFAYGMANNMAKPLDPLLDALTVTREERAIANKETPEQIETAKQMDLLGEQNEERKFKKIPNNSWTREDMTGFEKGTETAGNVAGEVFKNIYGYAAAAPLSGAIPVVNKIANPFVRSIVADQIADNIVQTPEKIISGIANKEKPLDVVKDIGMQNAIDAATNVLTGGAIEGIDKLKEYKEIKNVDAKMKNYTDNGMFGVAKNTAKETPKVVPINQSVLKPIQEQPMVKPTTINKTLTLKKQGEETAYKRLEDGIKKAQDYYGTNELRVGEIEKFKNNTGIDLIKLADDYAMQSGKTNQEVLNQAANTARTKRISGLGTDKAYKTLETVAKQGEKKPTLNIDGQRYSVDMPKSKPIEPLKKIETPDIPKQAEPISNNPLKDSWLQTFAGEDKPKLKSQFAQNTLKRTTIIPDEIKEKLKLDNFDYIQQTSKEWQDNAIKNIETDEAKVIRNIYDSPAINGGTQAHEAAILTAKYTKEAEETGSAAKLRSWLSTVTAKTRETARALKGTDTAYAKTSKEGKLIQAQRTVDGIEEDFKKANPIKSKQMEVEINETKSAVKRAKKEAAKEATDEIAKEIQQEVEKEGLSPNKLGPLNPTKKQPNKLNPLESTEKQPNKLPRKSTGNSPNKLPNKSVKFPEKKKLTPEELLANRVQSTLKNPLKKNDPIKTMVNELFKIAKESPLPEYDKVKGKTSFDFIKEAIANKAQYKEVWTKAKNILREKFKDNEDAFNMLDAYFTRNNPVKPVFSNLRLQQSVQTALKDLSLNLDKIARQDAGDKDKFLSNITKYIVDKTNATIDKEEATRLAKRIQKRYFELVDKKSQSILKNLTKEMPEKQRKTFYEKLRELNNLGAFEDEAIASAIKEKYGIPMLSDDDVNFIIKTMDIIKDKDPLSFEYRAAMSKVNERIVNKLPVTKQEKLQAFSRMMMIFSPKTLVTRNPGGNVILGGFETFKAMPSSLVDMYVSAKYGVERQTLFPSWSRIVDEFSGAKKGLKEFKMDIKRGVDTSETGAQYELPKYGKRIFQNPVLNFMDQLTRKGLQAGDRPFFEAAKNGRLGELKKIKGTNNVTEEMFEDAVNYAMERTYQNKSQMADAAKGLQTNLNVLFSFIPGTSKEFGVGNLAMPFTHTVANIAKKAIEYSPLGILDTVRAWKDFRKGVTNQKQFTDLVGRMFTGTGLMLLGWELAKNGMARGKGSNSDKEKAFNAASGENQYSLKIGTNRFTFDWADPLSLPLAVGIDMMEAGKDKEGLLDAASKGLVSGGDTFFKKSFMRGLSQMMGGYSPTQGIVNTVLSSATQFTPSAGNTLAKTVDNTRRETYDPNKIKELLNKVVISRTPFLSKTLPPKIDTMGKEMKQSEAPGALKILDVALSPGYYSKQKETPGIKFIKDLYEEKGDTKVLPKVASKTITIKDKVTKENRKIDLTAKEWTQLQKTIGTNTMLRIEEFARNNNVKTGDPDKLVKEVYKIIDEEGDKATAELQEKYKTKLGFN